MPRSSVSLVLGLGLGSVYCTCVLSHLWTMMTIDTQASETAERIGGLVVGMPTK